MPPEFVCTGAVLSRTKEGALPLGPAFSPCSNGNAFPLEQGGEEVVPSAKALSSRPDLMKACVEAGKVFAKSLEEAVVTILS